LSSQAIFQDLNDAILAVVGAGADDVYNGFTPAWYMHTGLSICVFLFTNSFVSNVSNMKNYIKVEFKRF